MAVPGILLTAMRLVVQSNVRAKLAPTGGHQAQAGEKVPRTARPGLVAAVGAQFERGVRPQSGARAGRFILCCRCTP